MKKSLFSTSVFCICSLILASTQLFGVEDLQEENILGSRKHSEERKMELRNQRMTQAQEEEETGEPPAQIIPITISHEQREPVSGEVVKKSTVEQEFVTSHSGAIHHPIFVTAFGDGVQLEDESIWSVRPSDYMKTLNWLITDTIIILPPGWFSGYDYVLFNTDTGARINVNLVQQPRYNGIYSHWIAAIDYLNERVCLEDGSIWSISAFDDVDDWLVNDMIIIGINDGWFSVNPNILINVNTNEYVRGKCIY